MKRDVLGLHLVHTGSAANPLLSRVREQLRAADALLTVEQGEGEPEPVRELRRRAEQLLRDARYEEAEQLFLDSIDAGLADDFFPWQAAVNLINCQRFLARLEDADATAMHLQEMYAEHPEHPIHYLLATQRGAIAADAYDESGAAEEAEAALEWARQAYDWQVTRRQGADGLRAYNLVVALLRLDRAGEAMALYRRHEHDDDFQTWCRQGDKAPLIAAMLEA